MCNQSSCIQRSRGTSIELWVNRRPPMRQVDRDSIIIVKMAIVRSIIQHIHRDTVRYTTKIIHIDNRHVQLYVLPIPPHMLHVISSNNKKVVKPRPLHRQHRCPPNLGSPGLSTTDPGGGRPVVMTGALGRPVRCCCIGSRYGDIGTPPPGMGTMRSRANAPG